MPDPVDLGSRLAAGRTSLEVAEYRDRVRRLLEEELAPMVEPAEAAAAFPRDAVARLGKLGVFRERWDSGLLGDLGKAVVLAEEMGRAALGGVGGGVTLHSEAAIAIIRRFGRSGYAQEVLADALDGRSVCCVAATERQGGSDPGSVRTELRREGDGWRVRGTKWIVSPGAAADLLVVLCRGEEGPALALVPAEGVTVLKHLDLTGLRSLGTARLAVDAVIPDEALLVRPGLGLPALTAGLLAERLALSAFLFGSLTLVLPLTVTQLRRREVGGCALFERQALRLRIADLAAQVDLAHRGMHALVTEMSLRGVMDLHAIAGLKATAANLAEKVVRECAHLFGAHGLEAEATPLPRLLRDLPAVRLGGGSDEVLWEMVAGGLHGDPELYAKWVRQP